MSRTSFPSSLIALGAAILSAATLLSTPAFAGGRNNPPPTTNPCDTPGAGTTYAARAYSISLASQVAGIPVSLGPVPDTEELPATGGTGEATLAKADASAALPIPLPTAVALDAAILQNTTMGSGDTSTADSVVTALALGVSAGTSVLGVSATVLDATATRKCVGSPGSATTDASTGATIAGLGISILGMPLNLTGLPTKVPANYSLLANLPGALPALLKPLVSGSIILNEQPPMAGGRQVVNALHVKLNVLNLLSQPLASIDLVVSHAEAGITCGTSTNGNSCNCKVKDFYTGGGQIDVRDGSGAIVGKASIAVNGSASDSVGPKGHLNLVNHVTRQHITGSPLKAYGGDTVAPTTDRFLTFTCADNVGSPVVDCKAHVNDSAESGGGNDSFGLVYGAYNYPYGLMARGNLQLHTPNCGTTTTTTPKPHGGK